MNSPPPGSSDKSNTDVEAKTPHFPSSSSHAAVQRRGVKLSGRTGQREAFAAESPELWIRAAVGFMESSLEFSGSLGSVSSLIGRCRTFKVLVIGDSGVGKTCLTHRLCAGEFPRGSEATIGVDFRERALEVDGERIKLQLWDTAGQERFRKSMVQHYYRNVHAVLFVYDVTCPSSFSGLAAWVEECRQNSLGNEIPKFLIGNKSDLRDASTTDCHVSQELAMNFAKAHGMVFFETSAKNLPKKRLNGRRGEREEPCQRSKVEDIVSAVGTMLKRHKTLMASSPAYSGSFKVHRKVQEKEPWTCC